MTEPMRSRATIALAEAAAQQANTVTLQSLATNGL